MPPKKQPQVKKSSATMIKKELFDPQRLQYILDHYDDLKQAISLHSRHDDETTLRQIKTFYNMRKEITIGGGVYATSQIAYHQKHGQGRYFANHAISLQGIARTVRQCIAKDLYYDIDISNAHPVILLQMCKDAGIPHQQIELYVNNRNHYLKEMCDAGEKAAKCMAWPHGKEWAKKQYLKITNWGEDDSTGEVKPNTHIPKTYTEHGKAYMQEIRDNAHIHFATVRIRDKDGKDINVNKPEFEEFVNYKRANGKETNFHASYLNALFCDKENAALKAMMKSLALKFPELEEYFIPCFDGVMIPRIDLNGRAIDLEEWDIHTTMAAMRLETKTPFIIEAKPMNDSLELPEELPAYSSLDFFDITTFNLITGDATAVFDKETVDRFVKQNIFIIMKPPTTKGSNEKFQVITKRIENDYGTSDVITCYEIDSFDAICKSLDVRCTISNPQYDPDFYEDNRYKPKTHPEWSDPRMSPYLYVDRKKPLSLGDYVREMRFNNELEYFDRVEYIPTLKPEPTLYVGEGITRKKVFNTFKGFPFVGKPPVNRCDIVKSKFYQYMRDYMFKKSGLAVFNRFLDWMADMFQDPRNHKPWTPVLIGGKGTLKSETAHFIIRLLGKHNGVTISNTARFFDKFNAATTNMLLQVFEEVADGKIGHDFYQILKEEITGKTVLREGKGDDQVNVLNFARKLIVTNNPFPLEPGERRIDVIRLDDSKANDVGFFAPIIEEMYDVDYMASFFEWLCERKYDPKNLMAFERTEDSDKMILRGLPSAISFVIKKVESENIGFNKETAETEDDFKWRITREQLNDEYRKANPRVSDNTLHKQLEEFGITTKRVRPQTGLNARHCYILYPPLIEEAVRKYTKISSFKLDLSNDEKPGEMEPLVNRLANEEARARSLQVELDKQIELCKQLKDMMNSMQP